MSVKVKYLDDAFPYSFSLEGIFNQLAVHVRRLDAVQVTDYFPQLFYIGHAVTPRKLAVIGKPRSTLAGIAEVRHSGLCRMTEL